jgi:hypothetical protein
MVHRAFAGTEGHARVPRQRDDWRTSRDLHGEYQQLWNAARYLHAAARDRRVIARLHPPSSIRSGLCRSCFLVSRSEIDGAVCRRGFAPATQLVGQRALRPINQRVTMRTKPARLQDGGIFGNYEFAVSHFPKRRLIGTWLHTPVKNMSFGHKLCKSDPKAYHLD